MVIWGVITWWYTDGWRQCWSRFVERLEGMLDYFSIDILAKTLFAPFRQISAGSVRGPMNVQMRAFFDRLFSRCIGAAVRLCMMAVGGLAILIQVILGGLFLLLWGIMPLLPVIGLVLFVIGWLPWSS